MKTEENLEDSKPEIERRYISLRMGFRIDREGNLEKLDVSGNAFQLINELSTYDITQELALDLMSYALSTLSVSNFLIGENPDLFNKGGSHGY